jgi:hypothetical protein
MLSPVTYDAMWSHRLRGRLHHRRAKVIRHSFHTDIKRHLDLTEKDRVARKSQLLLHRFAEAEAGVEESETKK